ncbi:MAG: 4Fe-4S ferredoxin, partial [Mesorhizobium sp.]
MSLDKPRTVLVCSCERSMPRFGASVVRGCKGARVEAGDQFCGAELDRVRSALSGGEAVTISCTQQAPLFGDLAEELGFAGDLVFANIRETGGWSQGAAAAGPKAAALLAMAAEPASPPALVTLSSNGVV